LLNKLLPGFRLEYTLEKGMAELYDKLKKWHFSASDFDGERFVRLKLLKKNMDKIS